MKAAAVTAAAKAAPKTTAGSPIGTQPSGCTPCPGTGSPALHQVVDRLRRHGRRYSVLNALRSNSKDPTQLGTPKAPSACRLGLFTWGRLLRSATIVHLISPLPRPSDMMLDLATLLAASATATLSLAIPVLFVAWRVPGAHHGLALWGLGLLITLSYPLPLACAPWVDQWFHSGHQSADRFDAGGAHLGRQERFSMSESGVFRMGPWLPLVLNMAAVIVFLRDDHWRNILVAATQATMGFMLLHEAWAPA